MGSLPDSKYIIKTDGYWFVEAHDVDSSKGYITVSAKGIANGLSNEPNDGADFGPDTYNPNYTGSGIPYTQTSGIQEAEEYGGENNIAIRITGEFELGNTVVFKHSYQTIIFDAVFIPTSTVPLFEVQTIGFCSFLGTILVNDKNLITNSSAWVIDFSGFIYDSYIEKIQTQDVYNSVHFAQGNNNYFPSINVFNGRGDGILIDSTPTNNPYAINYGWHDNRYGSISLIGSSGSGYGITFNPNIDQTVGGNQISNIEALGWGGDGIILNGYQVEIWFGNVNCDSNGGNGFHLPSGHNVARIMISTLWCSSNGGKGLLLEAPNGSSSTSPVIVDFNVGIFYAHGNTGTSNGIQIENSEYVSFGVATSQNNSGQGVGLYNTSQVYFGKLITYDNPYGGLEDNGSILTGNLTIGVLDVSDGISLTPTSLGYLKIGSTPQGATPSIPSVPASGTAQQNTNPYPVSVYLYGGTVTVIDYTPSGGSATQVGSVTPMTVRLNPGDSITLTYSAAPTWNWVAV